MKIRFVNYNICNGRNGGLESALRGVYQASMDLGIFQETKVTDRIYPRWSAGYSVVATYEPIQHRVGVVVLYLTAPHFSVEAVQQFGLNVVGFHLETGERRWYIVGCYLAPDDTLTIEIVVAALKERTRGAELLVVGYFNVKLLDPEGDRREEEIAAELAMELLEDISAHFLPLRSLLCRDGRTWIMIREGREVSSRTDYILGTD